VPLAALAARPAAAWAAASWSRTTGCMSVGKRPRPAMNP